jgi:prefoldin subunit 5
MRGVVSGSPYGASKGQMAVPVLFSKTTARRAGLKSPVGVIILKRSQMVKVAGGSSALPIQLRTGDRFKGVGRVNLLQRRVFYPRIVFANAAVYFRSKELSLAELSAAVDYLRAALADLQNQLNALRASTLAGFQYLLAQLDDLRKQLEALQGLASQITNLQNQINSLLTQITALQSQINGLVTQITTVTQNLATVCNALKNASIDPDGAGVLPPVGITFPPGTVTAVCP